MDIGNSIRTSFVLLLLSFCCILHCSNAAAPSALMVVGTVYCDTCFHQQFSKASHLISGASVAVECEDFKKELKTSRRGVFRIRLPPKTDIKTCSVNLIKSSEPFCSIASSSSSTNLRLKSKRKNLHVYSSGFFTFKPLNQPGVCKEESSKKIQPTFFFPPIPFIPSPGLPLPPNPLVPPPSIIPPIIPSPPPSLIPPLPPLPPPSLIPPLPPLPLIPSLPPLPFITPPPPPPASLFPPLPIPLPPNPLFPGNPPAPHSAENFP